MRRDCAMALKGLRSSSGAALSVHFDACAAKIRTQYGGARRPGGILKRFLASCFVNHGSYVVLALQHSENEKKCKHFMQLWPIIARGAEFLAAWLSLGSGGARLVETRRGKTLL
jgi:hypothetical protein